MVVASGIYGSVWNRNADTAPMLSSALLTTLLFGIMAVPRNHRWRSRLCIGLAAAGGCALLDIACRWLFGPTSPRLGVGNGPLGFFLGDASLHRHLSVWGDEGATTVAFPFAVLVSIALAVRTSSRMLIFAAALTLLGTATNMAGVVLHGYDTDYLRFAAAGGAQYNFGDVYEFEGALLMAWCTLRMVAMGRTAAGRASPADRPNAVRVLRVAVDRSSATAGQPALHPSTALDAAGDRPRRGTATGRNGRMREENVVPMPGSLDTTRVGQPSP